TKKVVYIQREPGLFEGVEVELGPRNGEFYPVIKGLNEGDKVAGAGGFLIDAETRLNPGAASTYYGASGGPQASARLSTPLLPSQRQGDKVPADQGASDDGQANPAANAADVKPTDEDLKNIEQLPEADRPMALAQRICPVTGATLGSMGVPVKITLRGQTVFLCCKGCVGKAKRNPDEMLKILADTQSNKKNNSDQSNRQ
ncbi:MAG TPA: hypothetical protein VIH42_12400, partial [Thermoguttaceae bacterium]